VLLSLVSFDFPKSVFLKGIAHYVSVRQRWCADRTRSKLSGTCPPEKFLTARHFWSSVTPQETDDAGIPSRADRRADDASH